MSQKIVLLGSILLSGCAPATVTELTSADASLQRFQIECSAPDDCQKQASLSCPQGYQETDRSQHNPIRRDTDEQEPASSIKPGEKRKSHKKKRPTQVDRFFTALRP